MTKPLSRSDPKRVTKHESKWNGTLINGIHCNSTYMFRPGSKHMTEVDHFVSLPSDLRIRRERKDPQSFVLPPEDTKIKFKEYY